MSQHRQAFKKAFPYTIPVLTGYLFIGLAFGVMYAEKGYSFVWAILMSLLVYAEGIDFAMTALFVVIFIEQWMEKKNRIPAVIGVVGAFVCLQIFGADSFVLPSMLLIVLILFVGEKRLDKEEEG